MRVLRLYHLNTTGRRCQTRLRFSSVQISCQLSKSISPVTFPYVRSLRYAGTKQRKPIEDLPQGLQPPLEPFIEKETSNFTPVIDEVFQNQKRFPNCVLLTRVGQFYEVRDRFLYTPSNCSYTLIRLRKLRRC